MASRAGLFSETIEILKSTDSVGEFGDMPSVWEVERTTRARVVYPHGKQKNQNDEIVHIYAPTFIVRHYHKLSEFNNRIRYNDVTYRIVSLPPMERDKMEIMILTEKVLE